MYHQRKYWIATGEHLFPEVINTIFGICFRVMGAGIASWDNYEFIANGKFKKKNTLPIFFFTDASLNLIEKALWFILCYFLKFNNKPIFKYQNIYLLYGSIWKNLNLKGYRNRYNKIFVRLWCTQCGNRIE